MKRIVFTLIILAGILGVKAQQFPQWPKERSLKYFKVLPDSSALPKADKKTNIQLLNNINVLAEANTDHMPVVRFPGKSNMPVVQTDRTGYAMPVVGKNVSGIYYMKKPVAGKDSVTKASLP